MSVYDTIRTGDREGQVKCWDSALREFSTGDEVPASDADPTYSIAMREGGFVNIYERKIEDWTPTPRHSLVIDKWGYGLGHDAVAAYARGDTPLPLSPVERALDKLRTSAQSD